MPVINLPISKGLVQSNAEGDWLDSLPTNMLTVPKPVLDAAGYMRSWPGLVKTFDTAGTARGGVFNPVLNTVFRVQGTRLVNAMGNMLAEVGGSGLARMPFSSNSQAIVSNGNLYYWRENATTNQFELTQLQNWAAGQRGRTSVTTTTYTPDFRNNAYVQIPIFTPTTGFRLTATVELANNQDKQWVFGSTGESGIFVNNGRFFVQATSTATPVDIGPATVTTTNTDGSKAGSNALDYASTTLVFNPGLSIMGARLSGTTPTEPLTGRIFNVTLDDAAMGDNSRNYRMSESSTAAEPEAPTRLYVLDTNNDPTTLADVERIDLIGGSTGSPAQSAEILATAQLTTGNFYSVASTVVSDGTNNSGWSARNGIPTTARTTGNGTVFAVFRATANNQPLNLFSENPQATLTGNRVQEVSHGVLVGFPAPVWSVQLTNTVTTDMPATDFDVSNVIDAARNRGRYVWIRRNSGMFGVTDLNNEQRPDYIAPFYSAEAEPDVNIAIDAWKGYVVVFGRYTVEYFALTGSEQTIYQPVQSLTVRAGIIGLGCKAVYLDSFAILGGPRLEPASVYLINQGSYQEIATRRIQKILREYTQTEIQESAFMESVKFDAHDLLVIHLPRHTLTYDHNSSGQGAFNWSILKTDIQGDATYRGIHHIHDGDQWTVGDKRQPLLSRFSFTDARHVGQPVEFILDTPMVQARNRRVYDLEIDSVPGRSNTARRLAHSVTVNGISYGTEHWIHFDEPQNYTERVLERRIGYFRNNVGFRLRWITETASTLSNFRVRVE